MLVNGKGATAMTDLRIKRTERAIKQSFIELVLQVGFEHVSIQTLADAAMINRQTFYAHYADKYQLAERLIAAFVEDMDQLFAKRMQTADAKLNLADSSASLLPLIDALYIQRNDEVRALRTIVLPNQLGLDAAIQTRITNIFKLYDSTKTLTPFQLEVDVALVMTILNHTIATKQLPDLVEVQTAVKKVARLFNV
ncbi:hypothetical protein IV55_GL000208 [Furfurilactobacillus siliginis]|uniref:HTH tetR-type domain-containing protein n=2 Tax=Furfurilactobacillus siliginis TaxID=348151 RepID=A0A0R2L797_9LACO|nr:hypothetical protein IV55_GL000208 [Furfurilactobacillus siliginis]